MQMEGDESSNIEDRGGEGGLGGGGFGGGGGIPIPIGGGGGWLVKGWIGFVDFIVVALIFGRDPMALLSGLTGGEQASYTAPATQSSRTARAPAADAETQFVSRVLESTEAVWTSLVRDMGRQYVDPKLVLYRDATRTACGTGQSAMGPFYCPADERVYLDLGFFDDLASRFHAPGQFPQAYVIAHEVGHHVQNLLGITGKVDQMRNSMSKRDANAMSVRVELQADCLTGVWAYHASKEHGGTGSFSEKDVEQAVAAATPIGDDRLQKQAQGRVVPDSFTHGSSAQRVRWLKTGMESGDVKSCDTF